jgi:hypothetical protein
MTQLAAAPMYDVHKIQAMLQHDVTEVLCCGTHHSSHAVIVMSRDAVLRIAVCAVRRGTFYMYLLQSVTFA